MGVTPLKRHHSPVTYFRITFLGASSEKNVWMFWVLEWRSLTLNTNSLYLSFSSSVPAFCRSGISMSQESGFFSTLDFLLQKMMCPAVCSDCRASYVDSPWHNLVSAWTGLSARSQKLSRSFIEYPSHYGSELQEVSQHTARDTMPLFKHYRSDSHLPQCLFPGVVRWGSRYPGG